MTDYTQLIQDQEKTGLLSTASLAPFVARWLARNPEFFARLRGKTLVDLACGPEWSSIASVAKQFGVAKYTGVDKQDFRDYLELDFSPMQVEHFPLDMLRFVSGLPHGSANFIINHVDNALLGSASMPYSYALAMEIARATEPRGLVIGANAMPLDYVELYGLTRILVPRLPPSLHVYEKPGEK
jgi:hypothetical protein